MKILRIGNWKSRVVVVVGALLLSLSASRPALSLSPVEYAEMADNITQVIVVTKDLLEGSGAPQFNGSPQAWERVNPKYKNFDEYTDNPKNFMRDEVQAYRVTIGVLNNWVQNNCSD